MEATNARAGRYVRQPAGYRAFIPAPLPPDPPVAIAESLGPLLSRADQAIGRLDGATFMLPDPNLFVAMYVRQEAVLSSHHPFLDGNGRIGRLLITLLLCHQGVLQRPILYLSAYLKRHRSEYYDRLMAIRDRGDWEAWLAFFLRGVEETAEEATRTARAILQLREDHQTLMHDRGLGKNGFRLLDLLFSRPVVNVRWVERELGVTYATANNLLVRLAAIGVIEEFTGAKRNRRFGYSPYLALFRQPDPTDEGSTEATFV